MAQAFTSVSNNNNIRAGFGIGQPSSSSTSLNICIDPFCDCKAESEIDRRHMLLKSKNLGGFVLAQQGLAATLPMENANAEAQLFPNGDAAQKFAFPSALINDKFENVLYTALSSKDRGFNQRNTILATSFCPDEINNGFTDQLVKRYGEVYPIGGLAGVPFSGVSGLDALLSHVPDKVDGKVLIIFAPHIGISDDGVIGKIKRPGQKGETSACGAAVGAYKYLSSKDSISQSVREAVADRKITDIMDGQEEYIINELDARLQGVDRAIDPTAFITYQVFDICRELLEAELEVLNKKSWKYTKEIVVVGGIMINRTKNQNSSGDYFQPLMMQSRTEAGAVDMYEQVFGPKPNLIPILGQSVPLGEDFALQTYFPGAIPITKWDQKLWKTLSAKTWTARGTLLASSIDPDELNGNFVQMITRRYGENFPLGGLAGIPFVGKSGLDAFLHHVPDSIDGKVLIVFAPHVGIADDGSLGKIQRADQTEILSTCGATVGALKVLQAQKAVEGTNEKRTVFSVLDAQEEYILAELEERLKGIENSADPIAFATYQVYNIIEEFLFNIFGKLGPGVWKETSEVVFAGGILINRNKKYGDFFMPLRLECFQEGGKVTDLFEETYGTKKPDISAILDARGKR